MGNFILPIGRKDLTRSSRLWRGKTPPVLKDRKVWIKYWSGTERGRDNLSDLIDRGYTLDWPPPIQLFARNFDGVDDRIARPGDDATLNVADGDSCALQMLIKLDAVNTVIMNIGGKKLGGGNTQSGYMFQMSATETVFFRCASSGDVQVSPVTGTISAGTWYGLTGILRANALDNDDITIYLDGTLAQTVNSTLLASLANADPFLVGHTATLSAPNFWDGDIAYARFWKKVGAAWTQPEIDDIVDNRTCLVRTPDANMRLQWWLNDAGSPTTTQDYTTNDFDGTYTGTTFVDDPAGFRDCRPVFAGGVAKWRPTTSKLSIARYSAAKRK